MSTPGHAQCSAETRIFAEKSHPSSEVPDVITFKPQTASAIRADVTIPWDIGGEQRLACAKSVQAKLIGVAGGDWV